MVERRSLFSVKVTTGNETGMKETRERHELIDHFIFCNYFFVPTSRTRIVRVKMDGERGGR